MASRSKLSFIESKSIAKWLESSMPENKRSFHTDCTLVTERVEYIERIHILLLEAPDEVDPFGKAVANKIGLQCLENFVTTTASFEG